MSYWEEGWIDDLGLLIRLRMASPGQVLDF